MSTFITKRARELGLKKVDATRPLELEVTRNDVRLAVPKNAKCCALARACKRQLECRAAYFFRSTAWLEYEDRVVRYLLPPSVQKEIVAFDRSRSMEPGLYQLTPPGERSSLVAIRTRSTKRPGRHPPGNGKTKRRVVHATSAVRTLQEPADA
jgi:hypothetical protein